jgi:hypothetical protein
VLTPATPVVTVFEQKMRWILQLEDARQLRGGGGDLTTLIGDTAGNVRRRSAPCDRTREIAGRHSRAHHEPGV